MYRLPIALLILLVPAVARADGGVFDVCKGESKRVVAGTGQLSIALVFPDDFPGAHDARGAVPDRRVAREGRDTRRSSSSPTSTPRSSSSRERHWTDKANACGSRARVRCRARPEVSRTCRRAHVSIACDDKCELHVDLERHGRPTAERWVRYVAPLAGDKASTKVIAAAGAKLVAKGVPPDAPTGRPRGQRARRRQRDDAQRRRRRARARSRDGERAQRSRRAGRSIARRTTSAATGPTGSCRRSAPRWRCR